MFTGIVRDSGVNRLRLLPHVPSNSLPIVLGCVLLAGCAQTFDAPSGPSSIEPSVQPEETIASASESVPSQTTPERVTATATENPAGYVLGEGDKISIQVFDEPDLTMESRVGASGVTNYSYLGDVKVAGKTTQQLEQHITLLLQDGYLVNPSVNVTIVEYRPFYINGEVRSPGSYPFEPGLTLDKAIALAGGLTDRASRRNISIIKAANSKQTQEKAEMQTKVAPGDIISIKEGFF